MTIIPGKALALSANYVNRRYSNSPRERTRVTLYKRDGIRRIVIIPWACDERVSCGLVQRSIH